MRNDKSFTIPIEFTWKVNLNGYEWIEQTGKRILVPVGPLERLDWPNPYGADHRAYQPLIDNTGLFREIATLNSTEAAIRNFANLYGQLDDGSNIPLGTKFGETLVRGETLEDWRKEIADLQLAVTLWDLVSKEGGARALTEISKKLNRRGFPLKIQQILRLEEGDPVTAILSFIRNMCNARLIRHAVPKLLLPATSPRLSLCLAPQSLVGAVWLQFAIAIDVLKTYLKCDYCGSPFEVSKDARTGKRPDAKFCTTRCRVNNYRARIERARRMKAAGRSRREIARALNTKFRTLDNWLGTGKTSTKRRRGRLS
jgi:hypothetical protein